MLSPGSMLTDIDLNRFSGITDVVAPSILHWAGLPKALVNFPNARSWASANVQIQHKDVKWTHTLTSATWIFNDELPLLEIKGIPKIEEIVFFHKKSRTLIVTDLCFNITNPRGIGSWLILNLFGTYRKFAVSKFFLKFAEDRKTFENSVAKIFTFNFDNIILSHGENVIGGAKAKLRAAFHERGFNV